MNCECEWQTIIFWKFKILINLFINLCIIMNEWMKKPIAFPNSFRISSSLSGNYCFFCIFLFKLLFIRDDLTWSLSLLHICIWSMNIHMYVRYFIYFSSDFEHIIFLVLSDTYKEIKFHESFTTLYHINWNFFAILLGCWGSVFS